MAQDPKVGTPVHFGETVLDSADLPIVVPRAAIVTGVGPIKHNGIINVFVMRPHGATSLIGVHFSEVLKDNCWSWPVEA